MKKLLGILVLGISLILLSSCAKPTVVNIVSPGDEELNCEQLENAIAETQKIKQDAEYAKEGTGGNVARVMLFWPAWAKTLHNADIAIQAANDRNFHLINIMKKKKNFQAFFKISPPGLWRFPKWPVTSGWSAFDFLGIRSS